MDYKHGDNESIQEAISTFDWSKTFPHQNANEKCKILTDILLNVFKNSFPTKPKNLTIKTPDWMNRLITLSLKKIKTYQENYANPIDYMLIQ